MYFKKIWKKTPLVGCKCQHLTMFQSVLPVFWTGKIISEVICTLLIRRCLLCVCRFIFIFLFCFVLWCMMRSEDRCNYWRCKCACFENFYSSIKLALFRLYMMNKFVLHASIMASCPWVAIKELDLDWVYMYQQWINREFSLEFRDAWR